MKKIKNIVVITGIYTNKDGQEKKRYQTIGSLFEDGENLKIKLDTIPFADGGGQQIFVEANLSSVLVVHASRLLGF